MARVEIIPSARADIEELDRSVQAQVLKRLKLLEREPEAGKPLYGALSQLRRLVVGNRHWRIVYFVADEDLVIVWCVGKRAHDEVYKEAERRVTSLPEGPIRRELSGVLTGIGRSFELDHMLARIGQQPSPQPPARRRFRRRRH